MEEVYSYVFTTCVFNNFRC